MSASEAGDEHILQVSHQPDDFALKSLTGKLRLSFKILEADGESVLLVQTDSNVLTGSNVLIVDTSFSLLSTIQKAAILANIRINPARNTLSVLDNSQIEFPTFVDFLVQHTNITDLSVNAGSLSCLPIVPLPSTGSLPHVRILNASGQYMAALMSVMPHLESIRYSDSNAPAALPILGDTFRSFSTFDQIFSFTLPPMAGIDAWLQAVDGVVMPLVTKIIVQFSDGELTSDEVTRVSNWFVKTFPALGEVTIEGVDFETQRVLKSCIRRS